MKTVSIKDSFHDVFAGKQRVLVVTAHPDDNEVVCGGTVARLVAEGKQVRLVVTTNGEKGTEDRAIEAAEFAKTRVEEQMAAGQILGIPDTQNFNLGIPDGELENTIENIGKIVWHIREFKPDIIITHNPSEVINTFSTEDNIRWVNHRDHRHTAIITVDAAYPYSRDRGFFPAHFAQGLQPHTVESLLLADSYTHPLRVYLDVTDYIDQKRRALAACPSVIPADHVEEYVNECKIGQRYYEQLRYYSKLY
jgi:LmbE family N-acetylglucosaminyl deacetylase